MLDPRDHFVRISPEILNGRYLRANSHRHPAWPPARAFTNRPG